MNTYAFPRLAVPLHRYAELLHCPEPAFFGVNWSGNANYRSPTVWTLEQRIEISQMLEQAQADIEAKVGFNLIPRYIEAERYVSKKGAVRLNKAYLVACGKLTTAVVAEGATVVHTNDPAVVTVNPVTFTDPAEVKVYHPDGIREVIPSDVSIVSGVLTISIPRSRLTIDDDNPAAGWDYTDLTKFEATVNVMREYIDTTVPVTLVKVADATTETGDVNVLDYTLSLIEPKSLVIPAVYSFPYGMYDYVDVNYVSGWLAMDVRTERAVVQFAHAKTAIAIIDDPYWQMRWLVDQDIPEKMSPQQETCRWGNEDGAWQAWKVASEITLFRAGTI